jgi:hypothetical protein
MYCEVNCVYLAEAITVPGCILVSLLLILRPALSCHQMHSFLLQVFVVVTEQHNVLLSV